MTPKQATAPDAPVSNPPSRALRRSLKARRVRRASWFLTLGVALGLVLWARHPDNPTTALLVSMAVLTLATVAVQRHFARPGLGGLLCAVSTLVVGSGLLVLGPPDPAGLVAVTLFAVGAPSLGGLGVTGGGILAATMLGGTALQLDPSPEFTFALLAVVVAGWATGRHLEAQETADLRNRLEQAEVTWALARRAQTDALTRLPNRLSVQAWLDEAFETSQEQDAWLAVLLVDVDHFKRVNDTWGHATGDRSLASIASAIRSVLRQGDVAGRWGGEEFLVVLAGCPPDALGSLAERLRGAVEALEVHADDGSEVPLTVSVGGVSHHGSGTGTPQTVLAAADKALYEAKGTGRNRVCLDESNARVA